nr:MAG TPA: hypothetical protein [Caudoviricetes sp.]
MQIYSIKATGYFYGYQKQRNIINILYYWVYLFKCGSPRFHHFYLKYK